jgi:hypothetical protein
LLDLLEVVLHPRGCMHCSIWTEVPSSFEAVNE